jgi:hypothetical protein
VETYFNWDRVTADVQRIGEEFGIASTSFTGRSSHGVT